MRYCDHNFHTILLAVNGLTPAIAVCIFCGQVRHLYTDGRVLIVIETGEVKKAYGNTNTDKTQN